ncbi:MAG: hypothetical protein ACUVXA_08310 [Candidatus Jordarchaeum sp.]|uniref:hypothetical protein n=1 Tax=Candidatus Jordarchaeum sp. TaxID=2823881 RepID=UPI00404A128E
MGSKDVHGPIILQNQISTNPIQIPIPSGWAINSINMSFSNIIAPNTTITMEHEPVKAYELNYTRAMSFQLPENQTAYLWNISIYRLQINQLAITNVNVSLYNSVYNDTTKLPEPGTLLNTSLQIVSGDLTIGWHKFTLSTPWELNPEANTDPRVNNTFFIAIKIIPFLNDHRIFWFFAPDEGDEAGTEPAFYEDLGFAYNSTDSGDPVNWNLEKLNDYTVDYCLKVDVSVNDTVGYYETPLPSEVNMKVNGTVVENVSRGVGACNLTQNLNISGNFAILNVSTTWVYPEGLKFDVTIYLSYVNVYLIMLTRSLTAFTFYTIIKENQNQLFMLMGFIALGAVIAGGYGGRSAYKRRKIPLNALKSMENILIDHKPTGTMIWSFDFISMQQDVALVSGFITAIKSFLEEMKVGGLKRLGTDFGTFIREESQLLTATCITSDIGLDEELWIRSKLHEFLIKVEQEHWNQLEGWKGDLTPFKESLPSILASLINLEKAQKLQRQKIDKLTKNKDKLQKKVNKYGAKLEELKSRYDSGEIDFKKYIFERYKTEAKYDKVQKDYLYASLFVSRVSPPMEAKPAKPKDVEKMENIQNRFLEIRREIEALRRKELVGSITSQDLERREKLQKELMALIEKLDKLHKT